MRVSRLRRYLSGIVGVIRGIQFKATVIICILIVVCLGTSLVVFLDSSTRAAYEQTRQRLADVGNSLSGTCRMILQAQNDQYRTVAVDRLVERGSIEEALILDRHGRVVYRSGRSGFRTRDTVFCVPPETLIQAAFKEHFNVVSGTSDDESEWVQVTRAITSRDDTSPLPVFTSASQDGQYLLGYLQLTCNTESIRSQLDTMQASLVKAFSLILLLSLPLASLVAWRVAQPIIQLLETVESARGGLLPQHVDVRRSDELGQLGMAFNRMADELSRSHQELVDMNAGLERMVSERTAQLERANDKLRSEIEEKNDFLRAVSHDLNAPLRNIGGMAMMLAQKYGDQLPDDAKRRLDRINKSVQTESDLIAELLDLSRIASRREKIEQLDLNQLVTDIADQLEYDLRQRNIDCILETHLPTIYAERSRMRQLFQNLIDNAIKYMDDGPERTIRIGHTTTDDHFEFYVADTGPGIPPDDLETVFYVFRRCRNAQAASIPGKGVGLASCRGIVKNYDGRIWADSTVGQGTTFRFTIGLRFAEPPDTTSCQEQEHHAAHT